MSIDLYSRIDGKLVPSKGSVFRFPGGEMHIKYTPGDFVGENVALVRGADANDYIAAQMWQACVDEDQGRSILVVPYLPGARADRGMPTGAIYYADLISNIAAHRLVYLDPHSTFIANILFDQAWVQDEFIEVSANQIIEQVLGDFRPDFIICPDKGARDRSQAVATKLNVPLISVNKVRDFETGKLSGFNLIEPVPETGHGLIVDDICDGGGTFLGVKKATGLPWDRISLYVSHGIFSGDENQNRTLQKSFHRIYTTNSHHDFEYKLINSHPSNLVVTDILELLEPYL